MKLTIHRKVGIDIFRLAHDEEIVLGPHSKIFDFIVIIIFTFRALCEVGVFIVGCMVNQAGKTIACARTESCASPCKILFVVVVCKVVPCIERTKEAVR